MTDQPLMVAMVSHRSTKGASKARRDHINHEIRNMRALLPISQKDQERLSYLHSMAAICAYIRKSVLFQGLPAEVSLPCSLPYEDFLQALHGFILVVGAQGRLVYVSENVAEYLGLSMIDVLQGDTLYDMVERSDIHVVKSHLDGENHSSSERSFVCHMQTSKAFKLQHGSSCSMLVRGSFLSLSADPSSQPLFVALCTPTVNRLQSADSNLCDSFTSVHRLDMTFTHLSERVLYYLGYSVEEMTGRSWYSLVHHDDLTLSADSHRRLMLADEGFQVEVVLRLQCKDLSWTWIYIRANKDSESQHVSCTNFIVSETEARYLQQTVSSEAFMSSTLVNCQLTAHQKCSKRQRTSSSQSEEPAGKVRRESEQDLFYLPCASSQGDSSPASGEMSPAFFTPPYSPASSGSPLQQEELSHDLLVDVHGYTDQLLSSPECSPSYFSYAEAGLTCHQSPPDSLPAVAAVEQTFDQAALGALSSPLSTSSSSSSSSSPACDFQACTADARLVPDSLCVLDVCGSPVDCALHPDDFGLLEPPQGGNLTLMHHGPHQVLPTHPGLLTPSQSPTSTESYLYSERERAEISILAQQISSLASSFATYRNRAASDSTPRSACDWSHLPSTSLGKCELVLDDSVFDSILKDLDAVTRKSGVCDAGALSYSYQQGPTRCGSEARRMGTESTASTQFTVMDSFGLHDQNTGLHQLNHYTQSGLQQGGLAEENLY